MQTDNPERTETTSPFDQMRAICSGPAPTDQPSAPWPPTEQATYDEEAWVFDRLQTLVRAVLVVTGCRDIIDGGRTIDGALDGMIHGTTADIIRAMGKVPAYVTIRQTTAWPSRSEDER